MKIVKIESIDVFILFESGGCKKMNVKERLEFVHNLYKNNIKVKTGKFEWKIVPTGNEGYIDVLPEIGSGRWGWEGDPIAVIVDGEIYPSLAIVELNSDNK